MSVVKFAIRNISSDIHVGLDSTAKPLLENPEDKNLPLIFEKYPKAVEHIDKLPNGYYQVEKIFIQVRDGKPHHQ